MQQLTSFAAHIKMRVDNTAVGLSKSEQETKRQSFFNETVLSLYVSYLYSFIRRSQCEEEGEDSDLTPPCIFTVGQILSQLKAINHYEIELIKAVQKANGNFKNAQLPSIDNPDTKVETLDHQQSTRLVFDKYTADFEKYYIENTTPQVQRKLTIQSYLYSSVLAAAALVATVAMIFYSAYYILPPLFILYSAALVTSPKWTVYSVDGCNNVNSDAYRRICYRSFEKKNKDKLRLDLTTTFLNVIEPEVSNRKYQLDLAVSSVARVLIRSYDLRFSNHQGKGVHSYTIKDEFTAYQLGYPASQVRFYGL